MMIFLSLKQRIVRECANTERNLIYTVQMKFDIYCPICSIENAWNF